MGGKRRSPDATRINPERVDAAKKRRQKLIITWGFVVVAVIIVGVIVYSLVPKPSPYTDFAKCLTAKGAVMHGTEGCTHCQAQKREFGIAFKYVTYVNCETSRLCYDRGIDGYPTWLLANGTKVLGAQSFERLAEMTGCTLPED